MQKIFYLFVSLFLFSCGNQPHRVPVYGEKEIIEIEINGEVVLDTLDYQIPDFSLVNQYGKKFSKENTKNTVYVADFFFTSCPTICPKMKGNMLSLYKEYSNESRLIFVSHTIDPKHDSVSVLRDYSEKLGVIDNRWQFVTGNIDEVYDLAEGYMVAAAEDPKAPGGFVHSGAFILIDAKNRIRGYYDGTKEEEMKHLEQDIEIVLNENIN